DEQEALREREVLLKVTVALERAARERQQRLGAVEADGADRGTRQVLAPRVRPAFRPDQDPARVAEQLLVQPAREALAAFQENAEAVERELVEGEPAGRAQAEPDAGADTVEPVGADRRERAGGAEVLGLGQLDRPEDRILPRTVLAGGAFALAERGPQRGVAGQQETFRECAFAEVRKELCDRHR